MARKTTTNTRMFMAGLVCALGLLAAVIILFLYGGSYNVAANDPHTALMRWTLGRVVHSSVHRQAQKIDAPASFSDEQVADGAVLYSQSCAHCHGAPGVERAEWANGMLPKPPDLAEHAGPGEKAEAFWIIRNGLKMTGMPAFSERYGDEDVWRLAAFVTSMKEIDAEQYAALTAPGAPVEQEAPEAPVEPEAPAQAAPAAPDEPEPDAEAEKPEPAAPAAAETEAEQSPPTATAPPAAEEESTGEAGEPAPPAPDADQPAALEQTQPNSAPEPADAAAQPEDAQPAQDRDDAAQDSATQAEAAEQANAIPVPPKMDTPQSAADESKLEPSLRPLPPPVEASTQAPPAQ